MEKIERWTIQRLIISGIVVIVVEIIMYLRIVHFCFGNKLMLIICLGVVGILSKMSVGTHI